MSAQSILVRFVANVAIIVAVTATALWVGINAWAAPETMLVIALLGALALCLTSGMSAARAQARQRQRQRCSLKGTTLSTDYQ